MENTSLSEHGEGDREADLVEEDIAEDCLI